MSPNTIDLRGYEQICTHGQAEQYAAIKGYSMYYLGNAIDPYDVDPTLANQLVTENSLLTPREIKEHNHKINCVNLYNVI